MTRNADPCRRLHVLMVMPSYYPVVGGMEIQIERQIPYLKELGIDVSILTRRTAGTSKRECRNGVSIRRMSVPGGPGVRSIAFTTAGTLDIAQNRSSIDVIHAHSIMSPTTIAGIAGTALRIPCVVTPHQSYEPEHLLRKPLGKQRLNLYRRIISRFVSISSDIEQLLLQHGVPSSRIVSIPNGIDTDMFRPAAGAERSALRQSLGLPDGQPIVVFAGRLQPVKQVDVLLDAWAGVDGGRLVILGDGPERQPLDAHAKRLGLGDRVEFRGMVPNVAEYLRASDIFVLPSASEGLPVALLEAMSSGLLPIATSIGGTVDLIQDGATGLLVPSGDAGALRIALSHALDDREWRRDAAARARETATEAYDLRVVARKLAKVYREVLDGRDG